MREPITDPTTGEHLGEWPARRCPSCGMVYRDPEVAHAIQMARVSKGR